MTRRGGKPARPGSVLEYKSWCITPPPDSRVIAKSKKPYAEMSAEERTKFCPVEDKVTASLPPSPPETEEKPLSALEKLRSGVGLIKEKKMPVKTASNEWYGVHKRIGSSRKRSRKHKRKTHRRRR
jgi:hypothetical protein